MMKRQIFKEEAQFRASNPIERQVKPLMDDILDDENDDLIDGDLSADDIFEPENLSDSNIGAFNYKMFFLFLDTAYRSKNPLLVYGDPGIGKTSVIEQYCADLAAQQGLKFISWDTSTHEEKLDAIKNPSEYFSLVVLKLNNKNLEDLIGIPDINSPNEWMDYKPTMDVYYLTRPETQGFVFFDEINHAARSVLNAMFDIIDKRSIMNVPLGRDITIVAAGNIGDEHGVDPLPPALVNRFKAGFLIADPQNWFEWAEANGVHPLIIAFVKANPADNFYQKPDGTGDPYATPRAMVKLSRDIKIMKQRRRENKRAGRRESVTELSEVFAHAKTYCGKKWARDFIDFVKYTSQFSLPDVKSKAKEYITGSGDTPSQQNKDALNRRFALTHFIVSKIKLANQRIKDGNIDTFVQQVFEAITHILIVLSPEGRQTILSAIKGQLGDGADTVIFFQNLAKDLVQSGRYDKETVQEVGKIVKAAGFLFKDVRTGLGHVQKETE